MLLEINRHVNTQPLEDSEGGEVKLVKRQTSIHFQIDRWTDRK